MDVRASRLIWGAYDALRDGREEDWKELVLFILFKSG